MSYGSVTLEIYYKALNKDPSGFLTGSHAA